MSRLFRLPSVLALPSLAAVASCHYAPVELAPVAEVGPHVDTVLLAGRGRVDITLPPGVALGGFGSEGKRSRGYRQRLYARSLVLQGAHGERVALVVADLPFISTLLQRWIVKELAQDSIGITEGRLLLSATHTHSAPGNFLDAEALNRVADRVPGFDSVLTRTLATRIAASIRMAAKPDNLRPACAAWGSAVVYGQTRNRSYGAFRRNQPGGLPFPPPPASLDPTETAVNPIWSMLRIDYADSVTGCRGATRPLGAYSIFAIHGTVNPGENDLQDPDIHGAVERGLERWMDSAYGGPVTPGFRPDAVHLMANGAEGDVSPDWPIQSRCPLPVLRPVARPGGLDGPVAWDWVHAPEPARDLCIHNAREYLRSAGAILTRNAIALYRTLGARLGRDLPITVASTTLHLLRDAAQLGICDRPRIGTSTAAGADDGYSRFYGYRFLGLFPVGIEDGGRAARKATGCHREKRTWLNIGVGPHGLPEYAPLTALRLGDRLLLSVPGEPTTTTGVLIQRMAAESALAANPAWGEALLGPGGDSVHYRSIVLGHTNGFIQYVTTDAEYSAQEYEGGSTLYGPGEALALARGLAHLTASLARADSVSPPPSVDSLTVYPGRRVRVYPFLADTIRTARTVHFENCGDTVVATWHDSSPDVLSLAAGPVVQLNLLTAAGPEPAALDDDPDLEIRVRKAGREGSSQWELRWDRRGRAGRVQVLLLPRPAEGVALFVSDSCSGASEGRSSSGGR